MVELSALYAARCREYERWFLSAAIKFPVEAFNTAVEVGLTDRSFAFGEHRAVFAWLCFAAYRNFTFTLESFYEINRMAGSPLQPEMDVVDFWLEEMVPTGLTSWARRIKDLENTRLRKGRFDKAIERMLERCLT